MEYLPNYGLANTATGFATLLSGVTILVMASVSARQPGRWMAVYWFVVVTGIFTITLHGLGETNPVLGERWFWAFLDTGSNIVVAWAIVCAVLRDFHPKSTLSWALPVASALAIVSIAWHFWDRWTQGGYLIALGLWGGFKPGQAALICFSMAAAVLLFRKRRKIPANAMPLLILTTVLFGIGLLLAVAPSDRVAFPFLPLHAIWHVVGAFGFVALSAFNEVRFSDTAAAKT